MEHALHPAFTSDDWAALVLGGFAMNFPGLDAMRREDMYLAALRVIKLETLVEHLEANDIFPEPCDGSDE